MKIQNKKCCNKHQKTPECMRFVEEHISKTYSKFFPVSKNHARYKKFFIADYDNTENNIKAFCDSSSLTPSRVIWGQTHKVVNVDLKVIKIRDSHTKYEHCTLHRSKVTGNVIVRT